MAHLHREGSVAVSEKRKFQLSVKFSSGYDSPMLNIEGDTAEEFAANVEFAASSVEAIVNSAVLFQAAYNVKKPQDVPAPAAPKSQWSNSGSQQTQQQPAAPAQDTQPPGPPPTCRHGAMNWKPPGYSQRTKKNYAGFWTCPGPRQDQCAAVNP
jgi:hypothetical protein